MTAQPQILDTKMHVRKVKKSAETSMVQKQSSFSAKNLTNRTKNGHSIDPLVLLNLVTTNNTLPLCIEAMEVNIDGTGHDFVPRSKDLEMASSELTVVESFFKEPFPGVSMVSFRRELRRYLEATGNAYIELIPNVMGKLVMMRVLKSQHVYLGPLSDITKVKRQVERGGELIEVEMQDREQSYVYEEPGRDPVYFIEFGATQRIDKSTGEFKSELPVADRGNEIIHIKMNDDPQSNYGLPRWISQTPSAVGSRKAEEQNLEFFDAGGIPNVIVFVKGGAMAETTTNQLNGFLSGNMKTGGRAAVVEVASTSGTIDKAGNVDVQVERFGSETMGDKMYENYDKRCEERIRLSFRLPSLFIGKTDSYNYATAKVAYQVAEAQVFKPDRDEFDVLMNQIILKRLDLKTVAFKSRPITLMDIENQLKALEMVKEVVEPKEMVDEVVSLTGITVSYKEGKEFSSFKTIDGRTVTNPNQNTQPQTEPAKPKGNVKEQAAKDGQAVANNNVDSDSVKKSLTPLEAVALAKDLAIAGGLLDSGTDLDSEEVLNVKKLFHSLTADDREAVSKMVSTLVFGAEGILSSEFFNL